MHHLVKPSVIMRERDHLQAKWKSNLNVVLYALPSVIAKNCNGPHKITLISYGELK